MKFLHAYRTIALPANIVSVIAWIAAKDAESSSEIFTLFWMKVFTEIVLIGFIHLFNKHVIFFYMNLGIGERQLYKSIVAIDLAIFVVVIAIVYWIA
ncbi:MAG: hypothetical protein WDO15_30050 [Bacteroidota bacterium]